MQECAFPLSGGKGRQPLAREHLDQPWKQILDSVESGAAALPGASPGGLGPPVPRGYRASQTGPHFFHQRHRWCTLELMSGSSASPLQLFWQFFLIGLQSFGGGSSTFLLVHQACARRGWMDDDLFVRSWALCQLSPGINLLKLSVMVGRRMAGWKGALAAISGMVLPSGVITALMTAGYSQIRDIPLVQAALRGLLPATVGLSVAMGIQMAQPVFRQALPEGTARFSACVLIVCGAALALGIWNLSPLLVLLAAGLVGTLVFAWLPLRIPSRVTDA